MGEAVESHAAEVIGRVGPATRADEALRSYLTRPRGLGDGAKRSVSRAVHSYYRWLSWLDPAVSVQKQVALALQMQGRFERDPSSFKVEALAARAVPDWLANEMDLPAEFLRQLQREPPLWIRVRLGKEAQVERALGACAPPVFPKSFPPPPCLSALRYQGSADLHRTAPFQSGLFEIQDISSQLVGLACAPAAGETWWDACAGEGGKTLHLSDLMGNKGLVIATDRSERRLGVLRRRAARAGAFNYRASFWAGAGPAIRTRCHGVLVDAPCSGCGTWQRNPQARWTTSLDDVRELAAVQETLLDRAAAAVGPKGRLVYSVCTLTRTETTEVTDRFEERHPEFEPLALPFGEAASGRLALWPQEVNGNGMFISAWRRRQ